MNSIYQIIIELFGVLFFDDEDKDEKKNNLYLYIIEPYLKLPLLLTFFLYKLDEWIFTIGVDI